MQRLQETLRLTVGHRASIRSNSGISGSSAVEFALVIPVFLLFLLGILAYGIYFGAASCVQQLAADAARASVAGLNDQERAQIAHAHIRAHAEGYPLLDSGKMESEAAPRDNDPSQFEVVVRFDASGLPIWSFAKFLPLPSQVITRRVSIKRGGH